MSGGRAGRVFPQANHGERGGNKPTKPPPSPPPPIPPPGPIPQAEGENAVVGTGATIADLGDEVPVVVWQSDAIPLLECAHVRLSSRWVQDEPVAVGAEDFRPPARQPE